ncbi:hypothetical protein A2U01_0100141, partial [Trifolium medium]|nr:hypothetical protein [Trifolium medium]
VEVVLAGVVDVFVDPPTSHEYVPWSLPTIQVSARLNPI